MATVNAGVMFFSAYDPATGINIAAGQVQQLPGTLFVAPLAQNLSLIHI